LFDLSQRDFSPIGESDDLRTEGQRRSSFPDPGLKIPVEPHRASAPVKAFCMSCAFSLKSLHDMLAVDCLATDSYCRLGFVLRNHETQQGSAMKRYMRAIIPFADVALAPAVYPAAYLLKAIRKAGMRMPVCKRILMRVGVFPILNHYYEPLFDGRLLKRPLNQERDLPGIDWNVINQLDLLRHFNYNEELKDIPVARVDDLTFHINNDAFGSGDAEFLYNLIRLKKPGRVIEIGSGYSTLIALKAIKKNEQEEHGYRCEHVCIEPYEMPWLEKTGVTVIRQRVEEIDKAMFAKLTVGDILFIDSSHMIRPQGDVLFEYLELLPSLNKGVIVHIHDIFSPRDYSKEWVIDEVRFWNEQYLLEAFLSCNPNWRIVAALNYLQHNHYEQLSEKCPFLTRNREPGSFYIEKIS
jgi:hypothetical protein